MKKLMLWTVAHPWLCAGLLVLFSAISVGLIVRFDVVSEQLKTRQFTPDAFRLKFDVAAEQLMVDGDPDKKFYEITKDTFGDDVMLSIIMSTEDVFSEEILLAIERITDACWDIDGVTRVVSLSTVNRLEAEDGFLNIDPLLDEIPVEAEEFDDLRQRTLKNPTYLKNVVSTDGKTAGINVFLESRPEDLQFNQRINKTVQELLDAESANVNATMYQIGIPLVKTTMIDYIEKDSRTITVFAILVIGITLVLFFRSPIAVLIPMITGHISVLCTLAFMAAMGYPINMVNAIIPGLIMVIGCTEDIHLLNEYATHLRNGEEKLEAIKTMIIRSALAITMTSLTTMVGFATLSTSNIKLISEFGITAAFGIIINFVITVVAIPLILRIVKVPKSFTAKTESKTSGLATSCENAIVSIVHNRRAAVFAAFAVVTLVTVWGTTKVKADTDFISFFKKGSPIRVAFNDIHTKMAGALNFYIVVDTNREDGIKDPNVLKAMATVQDYAADKFDNALSIVDSLRLMHREMNEGQASFYHIPDSSDLIAQYMLMLDAEDLSQLVSSDGASAAMTIRHNINSSHELSAVLADVQQFADKTMPAGVSVKFTGEGVLVNKASDEIARGQVVSLSFALISIFIIIALMFMSVKAGLLAMIPNVLPGLTAFGVMGWLDIPLNPGTTMVAVIGLGVAVDDTIHFMAKFHKELKSTRDQVVAMNHTIAHEMVPVISTSLALAAGLAILMLSNFLSTVYMGILMPCVMLVAVLADLFVTPVLLMGTRLLTSWDLLLVKVKKDVLLKSRIFEGLTVNEVKKVVLLGLVNQYSEGDTIIKQGDEGREIYLLLTGSAEIVVANESADKQVVGQLQAGDIFGEMAFISGDTRTASVIAQGPIELLQIDEKSLDDVRNRFPKVGAKVFYNFSKILSQRVKQTTEAWAKNQPMII